MRRGTAIGPVTMRTTRHVSPSRSGKAGCRRRYTASARSTTSARTKRSIMDSLFEPKTIVVLIAAIAILALSGVITV